jgi:hypothetical protein
MVLSQRAKGVMGPSLRWALRDVRVRKIPMVSERIWRQVRVRGWKMELVWRVVA